MKNISFGYRFGPVKDSQSGPRKASEKQGGKCSEKPEWKIFFTFFTRLFGGPVFASTLWGKQFSIRVFSLHFPLCFSLALRVHFGGHKRVKNIFHACFSQPFPLWFSLAFSGALRAHLRGGRNCFQSGSCACQASPFPVTPVHSMSIPPDFRQGPNGIESKMMPMQWIGLG